MNESCHVRERSADMPQPTVSADPAVIFRLQGNTRQLYAEGCRKRLPAGPAQTLGARVTAFFSVADPESPPLVGMLPFDPYRDDALYQPERISRHEPTVAVAPPLPEHAGVAVAEPAAHLWADTVARCVAELQPHGVNPDALHKVVLARSLRVETNVAVNLQQLARRLGDDPSATAYIAPIPVRAGEPPAWLVGATPELLVSRHGNTVVSNPLAGSAPRCVDKAQDHAAAAALLASDKDNAEHRYVVEAIVDTLAPLCCHLHVPSQPSLQATHTMWHLGTRIEGQLKNPAVSAATLAGMLHPTPAVCGTPRHKALNSIRSLESVDRGFYAGAVGWVDANGDGDWYVSIRCAQVQGRIIRLFAGSGIVADSQPELEVKETHVKFKTMLDALGIDDAGDFRSTDTTDA